MACCPDQGVDFQGRGDVRVGFLKEKEKDYYMIRKHAFVALAALAFGLLVAAPAEAGGGVVNSTGAVGIKKNATVRIINNTTSPYYVLVLPNELAGSPQFGAIGTLGWANKLGGTLVNPGRTLNYPVPTGPGEIWVFLPKDLPNSSAGVMPFLNTKAFGFYDVAPGGVITKRIQPGPVIE
jgi:hypothetical protein